MLSTAASSYENILDTLNGEMVVGDTEGYFDKGEVVIATATNTNDISQVMNAVVGKVDAIYIPSDNGFASAMATVNSVAVENQLPVFCAVEAMIAEGGIATTAINYYELGKQTAAQAVKILKGEAKASEIPVVTAQRIKKVGGNIKVVYDVLPSPPQFPTAFKIILFFAEFFY